MSSPPPPPNYDQASGPAASRTWLTLDDPSRGAKLRTRGALANKGIIDNSHD
jgi:hypothetical protein